MRLPKSISKNSTKLLLAFSIVLHFVLINFNAAEWGDSYRILRASELSRTAFYPTDEKRPPLFSLILALRPNSLDPISFARVVMFGVSVASVFVFYALAKRYFKTKTYQLIALTLFILNPVYLYWSKRIYADVLFSLLVLIIAYLYDKWQADLSARKTVVLGVLSAFSGMIRFEGYLVLIAICFAVLFREYGLYKVNVLKRNYKKTFVLVVSQLLLAGPYILLRNPLNSSYLAEPAGRSYDLHTVIVFCVSLLFSLGILFAPVYYFMARRQILAYFLKNNFVCFFVLLNLFLILLWPAAIPRLFVSIIPFLVLGLVCALHSLNSAKHIPKYFYVYSLASVVFFAIAQYLLKLQFLLVLRGSFILVICLNIVSLVVLYKNKLKTFYLLQFLSLGIWTFSTLYIHKDIYRSVSEASKYASVKYKGQFLYNDINSVSDWYFNYAPFRNPAVKGEYVDVRDPESLEFNKLFTENIVGLVITNEHDPAYVFHAETMPYLVEVSDIRYNVNGRLVISKVFIFNNHYQ